MLDGVALVGFVALAAMCWWMYLLGPDGGNPWLFRGGFFLCAIATLMMVAAVTHERAGTSRVLSIPVLLWIGTRSYGLYLYHWPIYQLIRNIAGQKMTVFEFVVAMILTGIITEASYRYIETPIRKGTLGASLSRVLRSPVSGPRNALLAAGVVLAGLTLYAGVSLATAPVVENEVRQALDEGAEATCDVVNDPTCSGVDGADPAVVTDATTPVDGTTAAGGTTDPAGSLAPPPAVDTTTTTAPPAPIAKLALGDSVMLGAAGQLSEDGFIVSAEESRSFINGLDTVLQLDAQDRLGDVVVVHLGTNGPIQAGDMTRMMEALAGVPQVLLLTNEAPVDWVGANNSLIYDTVANYANVSLLDWAGLNDQCPGNCLYDDGYHLRPDGQVFYADLIAEFLTNPS
jgi:hypothetical protein